MRQGSMLMLGVTALALSSPAFADDATDIRAAEAEWNAAIMARDQAILDRYTAPEFELTGGADGRDEAVPRGAWMANLKRMTLLEYETRVTDLHVAGDVAIATVAGNWTVEMNGRKGSEPFLLRDTWARRPGGWQVVSRYRIDRDPTAPR